MLGASVFAGQYNALAFAYGIGASGIFPILVHNKPTTAGARALTVSIGQVCTQDGITFYPLATNAPVRVGSDSNLETVTPSAVSDDSPGYGEMNFTATFSEEHAEGDPVCSGTVGLQEAVNFAELNGGGTVIVDAQWAAAGGTQSMIDNVVIASPATVTIEDNRTGI